MKNRYIRCWAWLGCFLFAQMGMAQIAAPSESDFYPKFTLPIPIGVEIEGGGITHMPDGTIAVCTRKGDVWIIENPLMTQGQPPIYKRFATGLHEPLGLTYHEGALFCAQRGELTKLHDHDGDRVCDQYETIYSWPLSTHYHEYSFGPKFAPDGGMFVSCNVAFGGDGWWRGSSNVPLRGWIIKIFPDGTMEPWATGMRSPAGLGMIDGELFYSDNQGDWVGSGAIWHVERGVFTVNPAGLKWSGMTGSPISLTEEAFYAKIDKRQVLEDGRYIKPVNIPNEKDPMTLYKAKEFFPEIQLPAVWLPHGIMGVSNTEIIKIDAGSGFDLFEGQALIGDQGQSKVMRVDFEEVNGAIQGVAFEFRKGFQSGAMRLTFGPQGSLFVAETSRGWGAQGTTHHGVEYITWNGKMPFEMKTVKATPDGFEVFFTQPVDANSAKDLDSYTGKSYIYKYHAVYGSPPIYTTDLKIKGVKVAEDGMSVRLVVDNLTQYHVHELDLSGLKARDTGWNLLHGKAYYTLNNIPAGTKLAKGDYSTFRASAVAPPKPRKARPAATTRVRGNAKPKVLTYAQVEPLLNKNTCTACHNKDRQVVGPSFRAIAKRKYSAERIVELIYNPEPQNWPEYATPMAPMPHVAKAEAMQIARWINSLK
ncbi:hypothetical protein [Pontibacter sp. G13]|uniref:hypothetical protein n=1 Tax=Pontibacter sp. G13 TaxID=3074898 RepID=UPI00288B546F|nr:hypothetical protein [Pontibacter sp. G13]WNJ19636.1 hypothetical protein RJD25_04050 [Pontibacter sp. G13]